MGFPGFGPASLLDAMRFLARAAPNGETLTSLRRDERLVVRPADAARVDASTSRSRRRSATCSARGRSRRASISCAARARSPSPAGRRSASAAAASSTAARRRPRWRADGTLAGRAGGNARHVAGELRLEPADVPRRRARDRAARAAGASSASRADSTPRWETVPSASSRRSSPSTATAGAFVECRREARRHPPRHVHHRATRRGNVDFYARHARPAARQEDRQPGRPDRLPPLLRGRARLRRLGHHVLRVSRTRRAAARAPGWCTASRSASHRRSRSTSGRSASAASAATASLVFDDPEGLALELVVDDSRRGAARRASIRRSRRSTRCAASHGVRAYTRDPEQSRALPRGDARLRAGLRQARGDKRSGFYVYDVTDRRGIQGAGTVHHVAWASTQDDHEAWRAARRAGRRAPDADHRPLLLQVDLLPRAERRPLRDRDARPGLRGRTSRGAPRRAAVAAARFEHLRERVEPVLTPLPNPREPARR